MVGQMSRNLLSLSLGATLLAGPSLADAPRVAADIAPVHSLVAQVMGEVGEPALIIPAGASPHEYNLRPSEAQALQDADLVFWIGPDLTPWLEDAVETLAEEAAVTILLGTGGSSELPFREGAMFEAHDHGHGEEEHSDKHGDDDHDHEEHGHDEDGHEKHDDHDHEEHEEHAHEEHEEHGHEEHKGHAHEEHGHDDHGHDSHGHAHGEHDPHAWLSPQNAALWLDVIAAELSKADPGNASAYFANAAAGKADLDALTGEIAATLEPVKGGRFIVFHDAYQYFEESFSFPATGAISLGDASDPSPARIAEIQSLVAEHEVSCVLAEPQYNPDLVATVLDGTAANTAVIDPLGVDLTPGPSLYRALLSGMATSLAGCLE